MRRVAVTGASGFLGRYLLERLVRVASEWELVGIARRAPADPLQGVRYSSEHVPADLVFHLAGSPGIALSLASPKADLEANVGTLLELLGQIEDGSGTRIVLASSYAVYGKGNGLFNEDDPLRPEVPYGVSKATAEAYLRVLGDRKRLDTRIARIGNAYGPGQTKLAIHELGQRALARTGRLVLHGSGGAVRDFIHAADVADALVRIALHGVPGGIYNVGSGRAATLDEVGRLVAIAAGLSPDAFQSDDRPETGKVDTAVGDIQRLTGLGFLAQWTLEDGIRDTVEWIGSRA